MSKSMEGVLRKERFFLQSDEFSTDNACRALSLSRRAQRTGQVCTFLKTKWCKNTHPQPSHEFGFSRFHLTACYSCSDYHCGFPSRILTFVFTFTFICCAVMLHDQVNAKPFVSGPMSNKRKLVPCLSLALSTYPVLWRGWGHNVSTLTLRPQQERQRQAS